MFVKKLVTKGIASGVGLAAEARAEHKEKKARANSRSPSPNPLRAPRKDDKVQEDSSSDSEDEVELAWELDDAAAELSGPPPAYEDIDNEPAPDPKAVAQDFLRLHSATSLAVKQYKPLPCPVILPQRRPKNKERGFIRAYPPILLETSGIDQKTFLDFLEDFDKASKASPVFDVINLACFAVGFIPNPIAMAVTTAVQVASRTAQEMQSRYRRNGYLDQINESFFKPRGLFCMIMTFKPDAPPVLGINVTAEDKALAKVASEPDSEFRAKLSKLRLTSGTAQGEVSLPEAAPLVYPAIDAAVDDSSAEKQNFLKSSGAFMSTYLDRRAQAEYAGTHSESQLVAPETERQFKSKYADPNHPIHSGTIWGLVTAGKFDPVRDKRARKAERRAAKRGVVLTEEEIENVKMGRKLAPERGGRRKGRGPVGLVLTPVRKAMQKNIRESFIPGTLVPSTSASRRAFHRRYQYSCGGLDHHPDQLEPPSLLQTPSPEKCFLVPVC
ncbi:uncharacterized protein HMPREF1541_02542 [Cyphellophora europaea CBS 101466]|uniref:Uncharacterized protein n=1 Tax=Cyphellophora europaea (strain CBS 101466) TaxID=1220924 RepID=W2S5U1_CYPE1|nr:uncharacterized protein HMPREF1541_02542 [Cyphellophora europaea CBS 101466]ETN43383.1 hypothetical protein HMPREF1541_02542 [Cyphellophora europaea CBS 101466]